MTFNATTLMTILRTLLIVVGGISVVWGIYDMFGDSGAQSSTGGKKIIGGIAFAAVSWLVMTWAIKDVGTAMDQATGMIHLMRQQLWMN